MFNAYFIKLLPFIAINEGFADLFFELESMIGLLVAERLFWVVTFEPVVDF